MRPPNTPPIIPPTTPWSKEAGVDGDVEELIEDDSDPTPNADVVFVVGRIKLR